MVHAKGLQVEVEIVHGDAHRVYDAVVQPLHAAHVSMPCSLSPIGRLLYLPQGGTRRPVQSRRCWITTGIAAGWGKG
jgi:hypothetical protein